MGLRLPPAPRGLRQVTLMAGVGVWLAGSAATANLIVHLKRTVWGCFDPNVASIINDGANPGRSDPQWIARTSEEGQCVTITPRSAWEPVSREVNGLTYVSYRGTSAKPGSFWVPTAAIDFTPVAVPVPPVPAPAPVVAEPLAPPPASPPASEPEPPPEIQATSESQPASVAPTPVPVTPQPEATPPFTPTSSSSGGGGGMVVLGIIGVLWLLGFARRSRRPQAATRARESTRPISGRVAPRAAGSAVQSTARKPPNPVQVGRNTAAGAVEVNVATKHPSTTTEGATSGPGLFRIRPSSLVQEKRGTRPVVEAGSGPKWHPPGSQVTLAGQVVANGMIYVGRSTGRVGAYDGCFVDPGLPVASPSSLAGPLGHWPSYAGLTPACRRAYLTWLASGKCAADDDIGYAFLYFYGLERRLIIDSPPIEEARALAAEVERLRSIYAGNHSFDGHSRRLLDAAAMLRDAAPGAPPFLPDLAIASGSSTFALSAAIAREVAAGRPLSFEFAAAGLLGSLEFHADHHAVVDAARPAFLAVLRARFADAFPSGFRLRGSHDARLRATYGGAAAGLTVDLAARCGDLPDPSKLDWSKLVHLGAVTARDVGPHAKMLTYHPERADSLAALVDCPTELASGMAVEARRWIYGLPSPAGIRFGELAHWAVGVRSAKWTLRHHRQVAEALAAVGRGMEPDPGDGGEHIEDDTLVQVFRAGRPGTSPSREFRVASAAASLVAGIAAATEGRSGIARASWLERLPSRLSLTDDESVRLAARLARLGDEDHGLAKVKRLMAGAALEDREFCAWSATIATAAGGLVGKPQVAALEAIHDALGVPRASLYAGLHAGIAAAAPSIDEPVSVSPESPTPLHPLPPPPGAPAAPASVERLSLIRAETERVSMLLADIFVQEDAAPDAPAPTAGEGGFPGLDAAHAGLVRRLLSSSEWTRAEFEAEAKVMGLMPDGAMEAINEWAFDHHGEALLQDGDPILFSNVLSPSGPDLAAAAD